jgi:hypothetical protein
MLTVCTDQADAARGENGSKSLVPRDIGEMMLVISVGFTGYSTLSGNFSGDRPTLRAENWCSGLYYLLDQFSKSERQIV